MRALKAWFQSVVLARTGLCFIVMGIAFFGFGVGSLNLFYLLRANGTLLIEHGWMALMDGGASQLLELLLTGYASLASYAVFKACEYRIAHWLAEPDVHRTDTHLK